MHIYGNLPWCYISRNLNISAFPNPSRPIQRPDKCLMETDALVLSKPHIDLFARRQRSMKEQKLVPAEASMRIIFDSPANDSRLPLCTHRPRQAFNLFSSQSTQTGFSPSPLVKNRPSLNSPPHSCGTQRVSLPFAVVHLYLAPVD